MSKLQHWFSKLSIPQQLRNYYVAMSLFLGIWLLFFDTNDLLSQFKNWRKMQLIKSEKLYYEGKISEVKKQRDELFGDSRALEKYAREEYLMKKPTEDVYLVEEEE